MRYLSMVVVVAASAFLVTSSASAYNRKAAADYAVAWSTPDDNANTTIYYKYELDCANFGSQCLIAGGIRFRSRATNDPNDNVTTTDRAEVGTGRNTKAIKSNDTALYSRVISGADNIAQSMTHARHGGTLYTTNNLIDTGTVWNDVRAGDLFMGWAGETYYHTMVINNVKTDNPKDIYYCAHTNWRSNQKALDIVADWKTSGGYRIICLPDAPTIDAFIPYRAGGKSQVYMRGNQRYAYDPENSAEKAGKEDLFLYVTFDTEMNTATAATVQLQLGGTNVTYASQAGAGYTNGWWTNGDAGAKCQNRTWCGIISAANLPEGKNGWFTVAVRAQAADGSYNDTDDDLAAYSAASACTLHRIRIDTRKDTGEAE